MAYKVNGITHCTLAYLKANGEVEVDAVARYCKKQVPSTNMGRYIRDAVPDMNDKDLLILKDGTMTITEAGKVELELLESRRDMQMVKASFEKVPANLFRHREDIYDGAELGQTTLRPNAWDYLKCPSVINGKSQPYYFDRSNRA